MYNLFRQYAQQQHLFPTGEQVLLAVSGGRDSVCLAHMMHRAAFPFAIAHCNFHLRPGDCDRDQQFVQQLAEQFGVPFHTVDFDTRAHATATGESIEEAARNLRYHWFAELCQQKGYPCLLTAHHSDDSIETFFLNLLRGTGISGLHGIRPVSMVEGIRVVRPLLPFSRADIDRYMAEHKLAYVEDLTNAIPDTRRNQLRLQVLPLLRSLYPSFNDTMLDNIRRFDEAGTIFTSAIDELRQRLVHTEPPRIPTMHTPLTTIDLQQLPEPRPTILYELLRPYGFNADNVANMLKGGAYFESPTHSATVARNQLLIVPNVEPVPPTIVEDRQCSAAGECSVTVNADQLQRPLTLRLWQPGDIIYPLGMDGHHRKLSDYLKDKHLTVLEKKHVYVLVDANGRIVWVVGIGIDHRFRLTPDTRRVAHFSIG